jgi:hypothetical protein
MPDFEFKFRSSNNIFHSYLLIDGDAPLPRELKEGYWSWVEKLVPEGIEQLV